VAVRISILTKDLALHPLLAGQLAALASHHSAAPMSLYEPLAGNLMKCIILLQSHQVSYHVQFADSPAALPSPPDPDEAGNSLNGGNY
jgi:hypothetical protein